MERAELIPNIQVRPKLCGESRVPQCEPTRRKRRQGDQGSVVGLVSVNVGKARHVYPSPLVSLNLFTCLFVVGSHYIALVGLELRNADQAGLELIAIYLPLPLECRD